MSTRRGNAIVFWPLVVFLVAVDIVTKRLAATLLVPRHVPHEIVGDWVRLTLAFNPGAAFGMHVGAYSRWVFALLTVAILAVLRQLYLETRPGARQRVVALALVVSGAVGNLLDRLQSAAGVVDFIDIGVGSARFWTFNVADVAVSAGAVLLIWSLSREGQRVAVAA